MKTCILGHVRLHVGSAWDSGQAGCVVEGNILSHNVLHSDGCQKYGTRCQLILCLTIDYPPPNDTSFLSVPKTDYFKNELQLFCSPVPKTRLFRNKARHFDLIVPKTDYLGPARCLFRAVHEDVHSGACGTVCRKCLGFRICWLRGGWQHSVTQRFTLRRVPKIRHLLSTNSLFYNRLASTPRRLLSFRSQNRSFQERTSTFLSSCFQNKAFQ